MALEFKNLPPKEAVAYFKRKGFTFGFDWRDVAKEEHAHAFTVAKVTQLDILEDIRGAMDTAIKNGLTAQQFKKNLAPILQAKGWWGRKDMVDPDTQETRTVQLGSSRRLQTIFDTNMRTAYAAGSWERAQRTKAARPYLRYVSVRDGKTRPQHREWHGIILPIDHPFWETHYTPNGWKCRCIVQTLSERDLKRYGYEISADPIIETRRWINPRTGEIHHVPVGIDPDFDQNVGLSAQRVPIDPARYKMPFIGHESARLSVMQPDFDRFIGGGVKGRFPVGYIDDELAKAIGADVRRVDLSQATMAKQLDHHPELTVEDYRTVPDMFQFGRVIQDGAERLAIHHVDDRYYFAAIKSTQDGSAVFLSTFHKSNKEHADRIARRGTIIRDFVEK